MASNFFIICQMLCSSKLSDLMAQLSIFDSAYIVTDHIIIQAAHYARFLCVNLISSYRWFACVEPPYHTQISNPVYVRRFSLEGMQEKCISVN